MRQLANSNEFRLLDYLLIFLSAFHFSSCLTDLSAPVTTFGKYGNGGSNVPYYLWAIRIKKEDMLKTNEVPNEPLRLDKEALG